jgi:thiol:disulfide interchange protein DsbD
MSTCSVWLRRSINALLLLTLLAPSAWAAHSNVIATSRDQVSIVSATQAASGRTIQLGLLFRLAPDWHIYWSDPGDAGEAPSLTLKSPAGATASPFTFPAPAWLVASGVGDYVETGTVLLPFTLTLPAAANAPSLPITAQIDWLVCNPKICVPEHGRFTLNLPVTTGPAAPSQEAALFTEAAAKTPRPSPFHATIAANGLLTLTGPGLTRQAIAQAHFYPDHAAAIANAAPQPLHVGDHQFSLMLHLAPHDPAGPLTGVVEITDPSGQTQALSIRAARVAAAALPTAQSVPLIIWIAGALLGGLILNLMPCVFPVLAIKALAVVRLGENNRPQARRDSLAYSAGAVFAMMALGTTLIALRAGGAALGWGFQFQSPIFIAAMIWLVLVIGLNFAGMFEVTGLEQLGSGLAARGGMLGSFATGLLAVIVATPCTAPFMGGAIAAALAAPILAGLAIFAALGLGIALPFLALGLIPGFARLLPRPGAWMEVLKQILAFPMFATAAWLLWVLTAEAGATGVLIVTGGAVLIAFALWLLRFAGAFPRGLSLLAVIAAIALLPRLTPAAHTKTGIGIAGATAFSPTQLARLRAAGTPVFVDMSAAWCITCQVNERVALEPATVRADFARHHIILMQGDWTSRNPTITRYLAAHHRDGVPLYVYYPPHQPGKILPQILTPSLVEAAIAGR